MEECEEVLAILSGEEDEIAVIFGDAEIDELIGSSQIQKFFLPSGEAVELFACLDGTELIVAD